MHVLAVNVGSSSLKVALWSVDDAAERLLARGAIAQLGASRGRLVLRHGDLATHEAPACDANVPISADDAGIGAVLDAVTGAGLPRPDAVGHRLVHGGPDHVMPEIVSDAALERLERVVPFAPLHLPRELSVVRAVAARLPSLPQVVCFDTAFHHAMPALSRWLPLPRALRDEGVLRYGFHGLSYEYVVWKLGADVAGRVVIAHLGSGASLAAVRDGAPVDTTMGLTPIGGLMMGTRSGDLDPGVLLHLMRTRALDADALERLVDREAGLLGVSGTSADVPSLLARRATDAAADEALALFCRIARKHVGAMAASLGGLDQLVFTGGIGEHAPALRADICSGLEHLGVRLDATRNEAGLRAVHDAGASVVSDASGSCVVRVVATDEERMIARHARAVLAGA
jgi:acetate kinase